jgi:hypothetical protein
MIESTGVLRYSRPEDRFKLVVEIDQAIALFYRALVPRSVRLNPTRYAPHITVVRDEIPPNLEAWGKYEGHDLRFEYEPLVQRGEVYYWLNVFSDRLRSIRQELGLPPTSHLTRPPDDADCFHSTIGNLK